MTLYRSLLFLSFSLTISAHAQEVIQKSITTRSTSSTNDSTNFIVNGYNSTETILKFFKPEEISLNPIHDPNNQKVIKTMQIEVLDTSHVVLKYLRNRASLDLGDQNFEHGIIPNQIHPYRITQMQYVETLDHKSDILIISLSTDEEIGRQRVRYRSQSKKIQWYDVDGKILTQEEMTALQLKLGEFESGDLISGPQAVEKYGDAKYAEGVKIIRRIKKD